MAKMTTWPAMFVILGVFTGTAKFSKFQQNIVQLDMAPDSVDDMYVDCKDEMEEKVKSEFLPKEKNKNDGFSQAWNEAEKYYNKKWKRKHGKKPSGTLRKEQIMAVYVYTLNKPAVYPGFNEAVRTQRSKYKTTFSYHALHFFLSGALQALHARKPETERCVTGFRRVDQYFSKDVLKKKIRFGSFTSSSMGGYPHPGKFGNKTCFEIHTCFGADISLYSKFGESEREVLAPPYEVFKVTKLERISEKKDLPCEFVYKVKSAGTLSNLDCTLFQRSSGFAKDF